MTKDVVGHDDEVAGILAFLDDGASSALVLEGEAGLGKTTLWRAGVEAARDRGQTVLTCNPSGSETQFSLSAVRDLLDDCFDELADELPEPQRRVLGVALLRAEPVDPPPQPSAIAASFLNALRRLADRGPVLVAVDDVQWLGGSSAGVLEFAARRLRGDPIRLLLPARTEGEPRVPLGLDRTFVRGDLRRIEVGRLSLGALGRVIRTQLGTDSPRQALRRLHETSGGNPLFALELVRALQRSGHRCRADGRPVRHRPERRHRPLRRGPLEAGDGGRVREEHGEEGQGDGEVLGHRDRLPGAGRRDGEPERKGLSGKARVKIAAGKRTAITIPVRMRAGTTVQATFTIVLKTNGRKTTETRKVTVSAK